MNGIYYRTIQRNEQTGETYFYISPLEPVSFAEDGLVKCYGIIGFYAYKMPIKLKGEYKDGIFLVDSESLPDDGRNDMEIVLNYVAQDDLTENQKIKYLILEIYLSLQIKIMLSTFLIISKWMKKSRIELLKNCNF